MKNTTVDQKLIHGFATVATTWRPIWTNARSPSRYVGAEEVEDDDAHFAEKMEGPAGELATQFHESEKLQAAQEKSQTPVFSAFGFSSLGVSCPGIAAEGDEQPRETRGKRGPEGKGEAKPEAVFVNGVADVPALADWLADHLDDTELSELLTALTETGMHRG